MELGKYERLYKKIMIRTVKYLDGKDKGLVPAFIRDKSLTIPIYYQYCQSKAANEKIPNQDIIGKAFNFRVSNDAVFCDVVINEVHPLAHHFNEYINNYTIHIDDNLQLTVTRLIIYNRSFIATRDQEIIMKKVSDLYETDIEITPKGELEDGKSDE